MTRAAVTRTAVTRSAVTRSNIPNTLHRLLVLGDSISQGNQGDGTTVAQADRWAQRLIDPAVAGSLADTYGGSWEVYFANSASGGASGLARTNRHAWESYPADVVIIELGVNNHASVGDHRIDALTADIDDAVQTIPVKDGAQWAAGEWLHVGSETIQVGGVSSNNLTDCTRGANSTSAAAHLKYAPITGYYNTDAAGVAAWSTDMDVILPAITAASKYDFPAKNIIILGNPPQGNNGRMYGGLKYDQTVDSLMAWDTLKRAYCEAHGYTFVQMHDVYDPGIGQYNPDEDQAGGDPNDYIADGDSTDTHPNAAGHAMWSSHIISQLPAGLLPIARATV